ncbi:hypothetical protein YYC_03300 [Plasmodium yoelii 17X]|uniref:Uncharacterized protein n=1 Tax=Plasmodium yoelii 17X TaxID=1323249 RepID=V7PLW4_PLAYE|nr:hypothetical protein YYC_03300 [Plasmodium yoelii 17X]
MNDELCGKFGSLSEYLPDDLSKTSSLDFYDNNNFKNYCPDKNCNNEIDKITIGFLWLLEQYVAKYSNQGIIEKNTKPFFLYIISWLSYKLKRNSEHNINKINDFYTEYIKNSGKYNEFISDSGKYTNLNEFIDEQNDLFNINIEDLSKFYDAFKLICSMYSNVETNNHDKLPNNANDFIDKYKELNNNYNVKGTGRSKIFSALSTNYNNFKNYCTSKGIKYKDFPLIPDTEAEIYALTSEDTSSSSSIGNKLFTVNNKELKIFFHYIYANINIKIILFVIWISETSSKTIFKRKNKKYKEENKSLIYDSKNVTISEIGCVCKTHIRVRANLNTNLIYVSFRMFNHEMKFKSQICSQKMDVIINMKRLLTYFISYDIYN